MTALGQLSSNALTAVGLAMDCTAIAAAYGLTQKTGRALVLLKLALAFGGFQALLFILGWILGAGFRGHLMRWDHWIAFALLAGIGGKMILESFRAKEGDGPGDLDLPRLFLLALATSIDAMAVGLGFSLTGEGILIPALMIGLFSCLLPVLGFHGASLLGERLGTWAERLGGGILVGIGLNILLVHIRAGI